MNPRITIVGAGPVGSLLALTLARRGYELDVFERRPDPQKGAAAAGRSINLAVSTRGLHALHAVGLDRQVLDSAVPMTGRMMHALDGARTFMRYGKDDSEFINSMSRGGLNLLLIEEAAKTGRVRFHFQQRLTAYDFDARLATFESGGAARTVAAEVIIGTDGSGSALRAAMPGAAVSQDVLSSGYKELTIPPLSGGGFRLEKNALHIWPRGHFMLIALPNQDGSFTCTLFLRSRAPPASRTCGPPTTSTSSSTAISATPSL
jgi:kynurenine 3-monooxygenase